MSLKYLTLDLLTAPLVDLREAADVGLSTTAETARNLYDGYHLGRPVQGGNGLTDYAYWKGPKPSLNTEGMTEAEARAMQGLQTEFQNALDRSFTSTNFTREVLDREVGSVLDQITWATAQAGRAPDAAASALETEADDLCMAWWRMDRSAPERAQRAGITYARRESRGVLRFRVAGGALQTVGRETRVRPGLGMAELTRYIRLECLPDPENCRVWEDPDLLDLRAAYRYQKGDTTDCAEAVIVTPDRKTTLRVVRGQDQGSPITLDLGGRITYIELTLPALISPQFIQNQQAYNTASTMILRNTELAGFVERYGINIEPPYDLVPDPEHEGQMIRRYKAPRTGPASLNLWRGATKDAVDTKGNYAGEEPLGSASYGRFDPSSPDALTAAAEHHRLNLYGEAGQSFVLMNAESTASGRSREVALADFDNLRQPTADLAAYSIGEILETFLALVSALAGQAGRFAGIRVTGSTRSRVVPPTAEERAADLADVQARVISVQRARQRQGVDDSPAEDAQIGREVEAGITPPLPAPAQPPAGGGS